MSISYYQQLPQQITSSWIHGSSGMAIRATRKIILAIWMSVFEWHYGESWPEDGAKLLQGNGTVNEELVWNAGRDLNGKKHRRWGTLSEGCYQLRRADPVLAVEVGNRMLRCCFERLITDIINRFLQGCKLLYGLWWVTYEVCWMFGLKEGQ